MAKPETKESAAQPKVEGLLEEDDEFEEFPIDGWYTIIILNFFLELLVYQ